MVRAANRPNTRRNLRSIGAISRVRALPTLQNPRQTTVLSNWHGLCKHWDNPGREPGSSLPSRETLMKNLAFLAVAFALSFGLMAATVVVPLGATPFIA